MTLAVGFEIEILDSSQSVWSRNAIKIEIRSNEIRKKGRRDAIIKKVRKDIEKKFQ